MQSTAAGRACPIGHNPSRGIGQGPAYSLRTAGRVAQVRVRGPKYHAPASRERDRQRGEQRHSLRGKVRGWSAKSRRRMFLHLGSIAWSRVPGRPIFITLTYPGERGIGAYPADWRERKRHLDRLRLRLRRLLGGEPVSVWKREYQRRGVEHFHLGVWVPESISVRVFRAWVGRSWWEIVGSGDPDHLAAGVQVDQSRVKDFAAYFSKYGRKHAAKEYQNVLPESDQEGAGRWWGVWGIVPEWQETPLSETGYYAARRVLVRHRKGRSKGKVKGPRGTAGTWSIGNREGSLEAAMLLWLSEMAAKHCPYCAEGEHGSGMVGTGGHGVPAGAGGVLRLEAGG